MKKITLGVLTGLALALLVPATALAMTVDNPTGVVVNGWYKDGFSILVHIVPTCTGQPQIVTYTSNPSDEGTHSYDFKTDQYDNPYVYIDGLGPQPVGGMMPCPPSGSMPNFIEVRTLQLSLDSQLPAVSITSPFGSTSTSNSTYPISGTVNDSGSGVQSVQLYINNQPGPMATVSGGGSLIGGTWSANAPLNVGDNAITAVALDNVGHSATSNSVDITRTGSSGGGGSTGGSGGGSSSSGGSSGSTQTSGSNTVVSNTATNGVRFSQDAVISLTSNPLDQPSSPDVVLAESGFPSVSRVAYFCLYVLLFVLLCLTLYVVWRFRPVFTRLDSKNSGLRRRIVIIVTLPSLLPLIGLGFLGYQQLSNSLKSSLSQELARAAQTSAIKFEREFAMRQTVVTTNASNILQIQGQFAGQFSQLAQEQSACATLMRAAIPAGHYNQVVASDNCLPFLASLAQLSNPSASTLNAYLQALTAGYNNAQATLQADEQQRINAQLSSVRSYFPETVAMTIIDNSSPAKIIANLPASSSVQPITATHKELLGKSLATPTMFYDSPQHQLFLTYPVTDGHKSLVGNAVVALDTLYGSFVPAIWQATPKPYAQDLVYFVNAEGQQIYPTTGTALPSTTVRSISRTGAATLDELTVGSKQVLATRVSQVSGTDWSVAVGAPPSTILAPIAGIQQVALLAIACFILLSLLLGILFVSKIAIEIETLFTGALRFAKGELDYKIDIATHDELNVLGNTMNQMAVDIKAAQAALVEKDKEFINIATHELKAPMTSIIGNLAMIREDGMGQVDATARKLIDQAYLGTTRLRDLVTDMLDVARLEAGRAEFKLEPVNIVELTKSIVDMQSVPAQQAKVRLEYEPEAELPSVLADKNKLQIIITNFISNAIKYNREGGNVTISHELKDGRLVTSVADTGLGIPADQQAHIFEKFYRVQHADRANVPGTGLGMYITKRFVESMGGGVWFASTHGQGTTFSFGLPVSPATVQNHPVVVKDQSPADTAT